MDSKFGKAEDYVGKWCLYKQYKHSPYSSVFVLGAKDGIVKIVYENAPDTLMYEEWDYFEDCCRFFVNPIGMPPPKAALKMPDSANDRPSTPAKENGTESDVRGPHGGRDSKDPSTKDARVCAMCAGGGRDCEHYRRGYCTAVVYTSSPPQYRRCDHADAAMPCFAYCSDVD